MKDASAAKDVKHRVGVAAAARVEDGMVVGLGTGSTAAFAIQELGRRVREEGLGLVGVPTSFSAEVLAHEAGLTTRALNDVAQVDLALDGADEVDPQRNLIKGGGAAHTQEKIIDAAATRFLVLVDDSKLVARLGDGFPVPVEVLPMARTAVLRRLEALGAVAALRFGQGKDGPVITDLGHLVVDARFPGIPDPAALSQQLSAIPGVVEHGLFVGLAHEVLVGSRTDGSIRSL